jgi:transposase
VYETGHIYYEVKEDSFKGAAIVSFLQDSQVAQGNQKQLISWDRARIHTGQQVKAYLAAQEQEQSIWVENPPPYSPHFNASEQVWAYIKSFMLKNQVFKTLSDLKVKLIACLESIKKDKELVKSFFRHPKVAFY